MGYLYFYIQVVTKLFVQINTEGREHENKYVSLWDIWSLTAIFDAKDNLLRRLFSMLITTVAFTGTARMPDHFPVCTQYIVGPLIVMSIQRFLACPQWYQQRHNSSDEVFFCFHNGFIVAKNIKREICKCEGF